MVRKKKMVDRRNITALFLASLLLILISFKSFAEQYRPLVHDLDMTIGNPESRVTVVDYSSLTCPHCATFHAEIFPKLKEEYIDTGKVKFVFRDFPFNYPALAGSMIMQCVPEDAKYQYMNALYKLQNSWIRKEHNDTRNELYKIMQSGGMQKEEFDACMTNIDIENDILEGVMSAQREFNIRSTPSFIIE